MTIERSGAATAPGPSGKTATVGARSHAVGVNHSGGSGARSFLSVLTSVGSQELEAPVAPAMADSGALAAASQPLPAPDPADLLGQGLNRMIAFSGRELAGQPDGAGQLEVAGERDAAGQLDAAGQPQFAGQPVFAGAAESAGRAVVSDAGAPAVPVFGMLPLPAAVGAAGAARDAGTELLERAVGGAARPGATGSGAPSASAGLARDRLENAVDARVTAAPEQSAGLPARAGTEVEPTPADTGLAPLLKGVALRSGSLREAAGAAGAAETQWHAGQPTGGADGATAGGALSEALAGLARGPASPRGAERTVLRPLQAAAGAASAGSWAEQAMAGANSPVGATYTVEPATPVPELVVAEKLDYWITRGVQNAELKLDAFGGGSVDVSISVNGNDAMVEFRTDQPEARRMLQDAMGHLRQMLEGEGLVLSGGFVGTSAQRDPGAQDRRSQAQAAKSAPALVEVHATEAGSVMSRTPGRAVDLFV